MTEPRDEARDVLAKVLLVELHRVGCGGRKHRSPFSQPCRDAAPNMAHGLVTRGYRLVVTQPPHWRDMTPAQWDAAAAYEVSLHDDTTSERRGELLAATRSPPMTEPDTEAR